MRGFSLSERHRKFAQDVGGIVLGVLIALALGEIASGIRWRFDAAEARSAMLSDLERDAGVMHERQLAKACIERRLGDVDALLAQARRSGTLPQVSAIGRPPTRPLLTAAWDMGVSSGVLPHLSRTEAGGFSTNFDMVKEMGANFRRQSTLWARLSAMENASGPVSPDFLAELMFTSAELRKESAYADMVAGQIVDTAKAVGKLDYWLILDRENGRTADVIDRLRAMPICAPLLVDGKPYSRG
jgi:hypothetical protein